MADLTNDTAYRQRRPTLTKTEVWGVDTSTAQTIYKGQPVFLDVSVDTTHVRGFSSADTLAATDVTVGIAEAGLVVAAGDTEDTQDTELSVITSGEVGFVSAVFTDADVGKTVYMSDSGTLTATGTGNLVVGVLVRVIDGYAYVQVNPNGGPTINSHI